MLLLPNKTHTTQHVPCKSFITITTLYNKQTTVDITTNPTLKILSIARLNMVCWAVKILASGMFR